MQYISPLVFASVTLVDPAITGLISWCAGLEGIPDLKTWLSGFVVISGVALITYGEHLRELRKHLDADSPIVRMSSSSSPLSSSPSSAGKHGNNEYAYLPSQNAEDEEEGVEMAHI